MKKIFFLSLTFGLLILLSCGSSKLSTKNADGNDNLNPTGLYDSLADHLRKYPGVQVREFGGDGEVSIRGASNSISLDRRPLYVLNGVIIGRSYKSANSAIDPNNIARIEVLKSLSETNRYGKDGVNGVIVITTKSSM